MDATFRALADPTRREILRRLRERPHTSGELAAGFGSSWPTVSRHLGVLREAGLVLAELCFHKLVYEINTTVLADFVEHVMRWAAPRAAARAAERAAAPAWRRSPGEELPDAS